MDKTQLANLICMTSPQAVLDEVCLILRLISPDFGLVPITLSFTKTVDLYEGRYPGYQACNTGYHDLRHITDTLLAMARLIHGAILKGETISGRYIVLGLVAALFHDAGYIQEEWDTEGTGGKYTATHVRRSMDFLSHIGPELGLSEGDITACRAMILYTDLAIDIATIDFPSAEAKLMGQLLGIADIWAQMSDRTYLEKLLYLFHEFEEAQVGDYKGEVELLHRTLGFYDYILQRLEVTLTMADRFLRAHFVSRWEVYENLYNKAIENQKAYLQQILTSPDSDPRNHLRRSGIVAMVRKQYGPND